jgi:nitroreductase
MDLLSAIDSRASAIRLDEPGPSREQLRQILTAGARAPDHGRLCPWRFIVVEGDSRAQLAAAMAEVKRATNPDAAEAQLQAERGKAYRAPTIVIVAAQITVGKIPEIEQVVAVGAGVQNMLLAAQALGYGAMWKTGAVAYHARSKELLGLAPQDHIVALLYLGTAITPGQARPPAIDPLVRWL